MTKARRIPQARRPSPAPPPVPQSPLLLFRYQPHTRESAAAAYESAVNTKPQHERIGREASRAGARGKRQLQSELGNQSQSNQIVVINLTIVIHIQVMVTFFFLFHTQVIFKSFSKKKLFFD